MGWRGHGADGGGGGRIGLCAPPLGPRTSCISAFRWAGTQCKLKALAAGLSASTPRCSGAVGEPFREGLMLVRFISQKTLGKTLIKKFLSFFFAPPYPPGGKAWLPLTLEQPYAHLSCQHSCTSHTGLEPTPEPWCASQAMQWWQGGISQTPSHCQGGSEGECTSTVSGEHQCGSCLLSKGKGESVWEGKDINAGPWGERLRIPSCLLICKPCQRFSILPEQREEETDAEIITTLAKNLFLYPEGELWPHSCLQDRVKAFFPWYIAMAISFLDKLKLTFILKRKITCCMKQLLTWHLPRTMG